MKILWLCRWFGNYRVPVYAELNRLTGGNFYMAYSRDCVSDLVHEQMRAELGDNAIAMDSEKHIVIGKPDSNFANSYIDIPYQKGLLKMISRVNPDIIISDGFFQWTFAAVLKSAGRKVCVFYERTAYVERNAPKWRTRYRKLIGHFVSGFLINGSLTREYLDSMGFSSKPKAEGCMVADCEGLSRSVADCTESGKRMLREELDIRPGGLTYLYVGQLVDRKGIKPLLESWVEHAAKYPDDRIIVAGSGVLDAELKARFRGMSSVKFVGQVPYDRIHTYLAVADVSVMPTLEDNWSLVVPEAMACGLPVATTPYNGCHKELIHDGENGYVFDTLNREDTLRMLSAFHDVDLAAMGDVSRRIVADYTPVTAARAIFNLCRDLENRE